MQSHVQSSQLCPGAPNQASARIGRGGMPASVETQRDVRLRSSPPPVTWRLMGNVVIVARHSVIPPPFPSCWANKTSQRECPSSLASSPHSPLQRDDGAAINTRHSLYNHVHTYLDIHPFHPSSLAPHTHTHTPSQPGMNGCETLPPSYTTTVYIAPYHDTRPTRATIPSSTLVRSGLVRAASTRTRCTQDTSTICSKGDLSITMASFYARILPAGSWSARSLSTPHGLLSHARRGRERACGSSMFRLPSR
ncbi:uncharacterized protein K452DRAFT_64105 [Aplosporella prunicola CBS 121167]|uniref:Uncharacterized protein n=1 Tax=Aplosporella prunicola CBS 121167 TaxID=1176127 RepID=A0A6A6B6P2_9PEZI|nr:uncharacterized protein K452DRAFT_64105 [Aplosporella prunicola CBS 121167]KAF2139680.1 hypothetical protein K452DRAFT_64105 [Aplosporella prunicola CBS 121167]